MKDAIGIGATYEQAVDDALKKLGVDREQVEIEPMREATKGFLGFGKKSAEVRAVLRGDSRSHASSYMKGILKHMDIQTQMDVQEEDESIHIHLGEEASPLIGHRGQTLDALQYLVSRYLNEDKEDWAKVVIDIDNYRDKREESLKNMAIKMAEQVVRTKRDAKTDPLTAPERRVIHMTLKENSDVSTFSIGEGNRKRVVIASSDKPPSRRRSRGGRKRGGGNRSGGSKEGENNQAKAHAGSGSGGGGGNRSNNRGGGGRSRGGGGRRRGSGGRSRQQQQSSSSSSSSE